MKRFRGAALAAAVVALPLAGTAMAQVASESRAPALVRTGKWLALGLAATATALGVRAHNLADERYERLRDYCLHTAPCYLGPGGHYQSPAAEAIYQDVLRSDRAARSWLIAGQTALVGSVVLFVIDLRRRGGPANEPFGGLMLEPGRPARVGWRLSF